jgi:hypothetical protein
MLWCLFDCIRSNILRTGIGMSYHSDLSSGGGGGRTAIQLINGVDAIVAGGGGGGAACYVGFCSGISGAYTTLYFACDSERLVHIFLC